MFAITWRISRISKPKTGRLRSAATAPTVSAEVTLDDLKKMPAVEVVAVNQCSGNRRGLSKPHVQGVEWGYGAMGCARWKGARLKDVLDKAGLKKEAIEIVFNGADGPAVDKTPDFIKSIPVWKAIDEYDDRRLRDERRTSAAFQRLPGAHHRAGWTGTYWMKHVIAINALTKPRIKLLDESGLPHSGREIPGQWIALSARKTRQARRSPKWWSIR